MQYQSMDIYINSFTDYLQIGLDDVMEIDMAFDPGSIRNILFLGLGGSGIGADILCDYLMPGMDIPVQVCKSYHIPKWVTEHTLVIASSYSGNTEEVLTALEQAVARRAQVFCISSGGKLREYAAARQIPFFRLPEGLPPRACIAIPMAKVLRLLHHFGWIEDQFLTDLQSTIRLLRQEENNIKEKAQKIAEELHHRTPIIYSDQGIHGVASRWRQQFNENSKILGWERAFPEMNHNELVGWRDVSHHYAVVILYSGLELDRVRMRMDITKKEIQKYTSCILEVRPEGKSYLERIFYLILLGDWSSWYLAGLRNVDAVEVQVIDYLKAELKYG